MGKKQPAKEETQAMWVSSLRREDPREEEMTTHSSVLAWRVPWTDEPGRLHGVAKESDAIEYSCVLTHTHTRRWLKQQRDILSWSGGRLPTVKMSAGLGLPAASLLIS